MGQLSTKTGLEENYQKMWITSSDNFASWGGGDSSIMEVNPIDQGC